MTRFLCTILCAFVTLATMAASPPDTRVALVEKGLRPANSFKGDPTWGLEERMEHYGVPGVGIAVIHDYKVVWHRVYGIADRTTGEPVKPDTLFQAGSISKPVSAFGALKMVDQKQLSLDDPVNDKLTSWKIPDNEFTKDAPVTLTHLTTHTGGLTVHGFPGYGVGADVPTLVQVLDGSGPANTGPIRVDKRPGESYRYSGGGYTVMQQMMIDAGGKPFPALMENLVLRPIGMKHSTYLQPLPPERLKKAAAGVLPDGQDVSGKRHTYPEMAAAGLWTTAEDLGLFVVEVQLAIQGKSKVLSRAMAEAMLEPVVPQSGRGFGIEDRDGTLYFRHGGWDEGFCAQVTAHRDRGDGVAIMINSNHPDFLDEVVRAVAVAYNWNGYGVLDKQPIPKIALETYTGRYRYNAEQSFTISKKGKQLFMQYVGWKPQELLYTGDGIYVRRERGGKITFAQEDDALVFQFLLGGDERQTHALMGKDERTPRELLARGRRDQALAAYRKLKADEDDAAAEGYLNRAGLVLLEKDNHDLAIALLEINCELYPESANTWDSVGYAYRAKGDVKKAMENYRKALIVDPKFPSAVEALAELKEE